MPKFDLSQYVTVQERITEFWKEYPDGRINTVLLSDPGDFEKVVIRAEVYKHRDHPFPDGADIAAEERGKNGMANTTSWHENASTSAIGRALANIGFATSNKDRPSREEMQKVERMSAPTGPVTDVEFKAMVEKAGAVKERWQQVMDIAGQDQTRWELILDKAPSEAWRKRFEELKPKQAA